MEAVKKVVMDRGAVLRAYQRWAPFYDQTFGMVADAGRRHAVDIMNRRSGSVLEVGVGTGLSLPRYGNHLNVTGVDLSPDMLKKAEERIVKKGLQNVDGLYEMDARNLDFDDDKFNTVVAMYVMTVVPEPELVMEELERVCAPGGQVILVNHFSQDHGARGWLERRMAPFASTLGWRPIFPVDRVMGCENLQLIERRSLRPLGLFTMLRFPKEPAPKLALARSRPASRDVYVPEVVVTQ